MDDCLTDNSRVPQEYTETNDDDDIIISFPTSTIVWPITAGCHKNTKKLMMRITSRYSAFFDSIYKHDLDVPLIFALCLRNVAMIFWMSHYCLQHKRHNKNFSPIYTSDCTKNKIKHQCGHTFCTNCVKKSQEPNFLCMHCRNPIFWLSLFEKYRKKIN